MALKPYAANLSTETADRLLAVDIGAVAAQSDVQRAVRAESDSRPAIH